MKKLLLSLATLLFLGILGFLIWSSTPLGPQPDVYNALQSNELISVRNDNGLIFTPANEDVRTGLILYPGGRVDYRSYAPIARTIAEKGYIVIIPKMVLNLAVFSPNAAEQFISNYPQIEYWVIGGHSLGGAMAASYSYQNPESIDGLILISAYTTKSADLSLSKIPVLSLSGNLDGLSTPEKINSYKYLLPLETSYYIVEGGNHAQMGNYGAQPGDGIALISQSEQQKLVVEQVVGFLRGIEK